MVIVITGVGSGLGFELARRYISKGHKLYLLSRNSESMQKLSDLAKNIGVECFYYEVDVNDFERLQYISNEICQKEPIIDVVIANAGISAGHNASVQEFTVFRRIININLLGVHALFEPFIHKMISQKGGKLVIISSLASFVAMPTTLAYSASKRALNSYADSIRLSLCEFGIKVVNIQPGFIKTPMTAKNRFKMPFLMELKNGVDEIEWAIEKSAKNHAFPFVFANLVRFLAIIPRFLRDYLILRLSKNAYKK